MRDGREELMRLRAEYEALCDRRLAEMGLQEEFKTIKTEDFVTRERVLLHKCAAEKKRLGIVTDEPGHTYGMTYGSRKRGSWEFKGRKKVLTGEDENGTQTDSE